MKESDSDSQRGDNLHCVRMCRPAIGPIVEGFTAEGFLHGNPGPDPLQQPLAEQVQSVTANEKPSTNPDGCDDGRGLERLSSASRGRSFPALFDGRCLVLQQASKARGSRGRHAQACMHLDRPRLAASNWKSHRRASSRSSRTRTSRVGL